MQAVMTQNLFNLLGGYRTENDVATTPSQFSNAPGVDNNTNLLTMSVGTFVDDVYERTPSPENQRLIKVTNNRILGCQSGYATRVMAYKNDFSSYYVNWEHLRDVALMTPDIFISRSSVRDLFSYKTPYNTGRGWVPMLCDGDDIITRETSDVSGRIISHNNTTLSYVGNADGSFRVDIETACPETVPNFTVKSILFSTVPNVYYAYFVSNFPPIILFGVNLDEPIELTAGEKLEMSITFKMDFTG